MKNALKILSLVCMMSLSAAAYAEEKASDDKAEAAKQEEAAPAPAAKVTAGAAGVPAPNPVPPVAPMMQGQVITPPPQMGMPGMPMGMPGMAAVGEVVTSCQDAAGKADLKKLEDTVMQLQAQIAELQKMLEKSDKK